MRKLILFLVCIILLAVTWNVYGGWERVRPNSTIWTQEPSDATCWGRDSADDLYPLGYIAVYDNTRHYLQGGTYPANSKVIGTGLWHKDADGDLSPINTTGLYDRRKDHGIRKGIEWEVDSDGDIVPKA